jgi:uncharacterized membrane protein
MEYNSVDMEGQSPQGKEENAALLRIEELLRRQNQTSEKTLQQAKVRTILCIVAVAVIVIGLLASYMLLEQRTRGIDDLIASTSELVEVVKQDTNSIMGQLLGIDFKTLQEGLEGIASISFDALNESIEALQKIIEPFANFMGMFGKNS